MKKIVLWLFLSLMVFAEQAYAVNLRDLFEMDVPVTSQLADERDAAVRDGFYQMLVRLTGDTEIGQNEVIKEALKRAEYYVQEFSYSAPSPDSSTFLLHVYFEANDVKRLLKKANVVYWGQKRPLLVVWLVTKDSKDQAEIISDDSAPDLLNVMKRQGRKVGLPLIFPLMDIEDINLVTPDTITTAALPTLQEASKRYAPNGYLVGVVEQAADAKGYESKWQLILDKDKWSWEIAGKSEADITEAVLSEVSQTFAKRFGVKSSTIDNN